MGIQQLKAFFHKEDVNVGTSEFQDLINQKLIDCELKNEKGDSVLLESLIESPTLLVFTNHSCQACQGRAPADAVAANRPAPQHRRRGGLGAVVGGAGSALDLVRLPSPFGDDVDCQLGYPDFHCRNFQLDVL